MGISVHDASGGLRVTPAVSATTVTTTGNIDNLDFGNADLIRMNNASLSTIRGLVAGRSGQTVTIVSIGAGQVDFAHQNAGSSAANRLINLATSMVTSAAAGSGAATYQYDATTARWRLISHSQGAPIAYTVTWTGSVSNPAIGNGTLNGQYFLTNRELSVFINVSMGSTTTFGTGFWQFSTPVAPSTVITPGTGAFVYDNSSGTPGGLIAATYSSFGSGGFLAYDSTGAGVDATHPFTWATSDLIRMSLNIVID